MLQQLKDVISAVQGINYLEAIEQAINDHAYYAEDLIVAQLSKGMDGNGNPLPDYSPTSIEHFGKRPGPMTLQDTHDFVNHLVVKADNGTVKEESTDWKDEMLAHAYGPQILKLSRESKTELLTLVQATFVDIIRQKTGMR